MPLVPYKEILMRIQYSEFTSSVVTFSPSREEHEILLVCLKAAKSRYEDQANIEVFDYFIEKLECELSQMTQ